MQETEETRVWSLGQENPLEEGMATHCSTLAWRIAQMEGPGGLSYGPQSRRELHTTKATQHTGTYMDV